MPPRSLKRGLVLVANIGKSSLDQNSLEDEPFLDKEKYAMKLLIEKKIFLQPKDEIGIITMGDNETKNEDNIPNVKEYCHMLVPNFELLKYVNTLEPTTNTSNWIEGLFVAFSFVKREVLDNTETVIVVLNNFKEKTEIMEKYDTNAICSELEEMPNINLLFLGENDFSKEENIEANSSEKLMLSLCEMGLAQYDSVDNFVKNKNFYVPTPPKPMGWKCDLNWNGLLIPCITYIKVSPAKNIANWEIFLNDYDPFLSSEMDDNSKVNLQNIAKLKKKQSYTDNYRNEIEPEKVIQGYMVGGKCIPISDDDNISMKYGGSKKGMTIYGFVPQNEVKLEFWSGSGSRIIVPGSPEVAPAFYSIVNAMVQKNYVALVRKVYLDNKAPKMGILFPRVYDDEIWCLIHLELPYKEESYTDYPIAPLKPLKGTDKETKLKAIDDYIESMMLPEDEARYDPGNYPDIETQYAYNAISHKILNPDKPMIDLDHHILNYLNPLDYISSKSEKYSKQLADLFLLDEPANKQEIELNKKTDKINDKINEKSTDQDDHKIFDPECDDDDLDFDDIY